MPNTPALIGEGVSAYSLSDNCAPGDARLVEYVFSACGVVASVPEGLMDAVTGLAVQTVIGAARMVQTASEHPSVLRSRVMSPGGTTARGLFALERGAFKGVVMSAVTEAAAQSARMARKNSGHRKL